MSFETRSIDADAEFWPSAARAVCGFAQNHGIDLARMQTVTWIVPAGAHVALARAALFEALGRRAFVPPRIAPLAAWLACALQADTGARAELFTALRSNAWVRESFGSEPTALWALAQGVLQLCDELTLAAVDDADALSRRIDGALARHFHRRAARALQPQSQLVLQLWRARRTANDGAARALAELKARADAAAAPLVFVDDSAPGCEQGWLKAFLSRYSAGAPVLQIRVDSAGLIAARPLLAAAWPELTGGQRTLPIAARADAVRTAAAVEPAPLAIVGAASLEEEAGAVARQVLRWLEAGVGSVALVALDRLTARRVRALLERAQVLVRDETGWKLSTTSAAAAVMRWLDVVGGDCYWRDLLDWLKSPFVLAERRDKAAVVGVVERAIRTCGALQGVPVIRRALRELQGREASKLLDAADELLALIEAQMQSMRRTSAKFVTWIGALGHSLDALGMQAGLASDAVGRSVLLELDAIGAAVAGVDGYAALAEFRALLAARFEESAHIEHEVESPVVMLPLAATLLRRFDAALLIGADARHLPTAPAETLFMSNAVRSELGLRTADQALLTQSHQAAALIASTPRVVATWRMQERDEPNALSPLLERLAFVAQRNGRNLQQSSEDVTTEVAAEPAVRPAPCAGQLLPARISATQAQSLVDCAYQFYARRLLRLDRLDDVVEMPDKRDFGEALHEVLRRFHADWGTVAFHEVAIDSLNESLVAQASAVFAPLVERAPAALAFQRRFAGLIPRYLDWLREHSAQGWRWHAAEDQQSRPLVLQDGRSVELNGRIDRIDEADDGRICVLDYKARSSDVLRRGLKRPGEDIQLPFYGLLLQHRAQAAAYVSFDRAKENERGVVTVPVPQEFAQLAQEVEARLANDLQRIADGTSLPAIGAEVICARCEMRGLCRRDYWEHGDDGATAAVEGAAS